MHLYFSLSVSTRQVRVLIWIYYICFCQILQKETPGRVCEIRNYSIRELTASIDNLDSSGGDIPSPIDNLVEHIRKDMALAPRILAAPKRLLSSGHTGRL